jgi:hypothetical protein
MVRKKTEVWNETNNGVLGGDAVGYPRYFRSTSFTPMAVDAVNRALPSLLPLLMPYYVNTTHQAAAGK